MFPLRPNSYIGATLVTSHILFLQFEMREETKPTYMVGKTSWSVSYPCSHPLNFSQTDGLDKSSHRTFSLLWASTALILSLFRIEAMIAFNPGTTVNRLKGDKIKPDSTTKSFFGRLIFFLCWQEKLIESQNH